MTESMDPMNDQPEKPADGRSSGWGRVGRVILRLILVLALGIALGGGLYFGVPALIRAWMEPVEANQAQIAELSADMAALQSEQADTLEAQAERIASLEGELASNRERTAELESQLERLDRGLSDLQATQRQLDRLADQVKSLDSDLAAAEDDVAELKQVGPAAEQLVSALERRLAYLRLMELIARARVESLQDNYGLAVENLDLARGSLQVLLSAADDDEREVLEAVNTRLTLAQGELPANPALAADDMEAAWRQLVDLSGSDQPGPSTGN